MMPIVPHLASECLIEIAPDIEISWPQVNKKYLEDVKYNIVVQINGKKRGLITTENSLEEKRLIELIKETNDLKKIIDNKKITKIIYIKNRLINLIIK